MDARSMKPRNFVADTINFTEEVHKSRQLQIKWFQKYEWLLDEHTKLQEEIRELCREKNARVAEDAITSESKRTCLPAPVTTTGEYGWLAAKPEFRLEKYGSYVPEYPDPLSDITHLPGNIPVLAAGKGFIS